MKILIAEDDPVSRRILETALKRWGYDVSVTSDGEQAWAALRRPDAPSLAILDLMMPGIGGLEICRRVRELPSATPPYLIVLTALTSKEDIVRGIQAGANDYVSKPFDREELKVRIGVGTKMLSLQKALAARVEELEEALAQVTQLQGILPICSYCKQVRDDQNFWQKVEDYISAHADVQFSHGICPRCYDGVMGKYQEQKHDRTALVVAQTTELIE